MRFNIFEKKIDWHNHIFCIDELRDGLTLEELQKNYDWLFTEDKIWNHAILGLKKMDNRIFLKWYGGNWGKGVWGEGYFVDKNGTEKLSYTLNLNLNIPTLKSRLFYSN